MAVKDPTSSALSLLASAGTSMARSGMRLPSRVRGWDTPLNAALYHADRASFSFCQVRKSSVNDTSIHVCAGRFRINGVVFVYAGGTVDLASRNNLTSKVWIYVDGGAVTIGFGADWPSTAHVPLASVTLAGGAFAEDDILDNRPALSVIQMPAIGDLTQTISDPPTQAEVEAIQDKVNEFMQAFRDAGQLLSE